MTARAATGFAAAALFILVGHARADDGVPSGPTTRFGERHAVVLTLEHLAGFAHVQTSADSERDKNNTVGIFPPGIGVRFGAAGMLSVGRFGLTLGGLVGAASDTTHVGKTEVATNALLLGGRVGWVWPIHDRFAAWLRAGVTWSHVAAEGGEDSRDAGLWAVEALALYFAFDHVALTCGPIVERFFYGRRSDVKHAGESDYGLTLGLLIDFEP